MDMAIRDLQPSQFYLSAGKLERVMSWFDPRALSGFEPLPVKPGTRALRCAERGAGARAGHVGRGRNGQRCLPAARGRGH